MSKVQVSSRQNSLLAIFQNLVGLTYKYVILAVVLALVIIVGEFGRTALRIFESQGNTPVGDTQAIIDYKVSGVLQGINQLSFAESVSVILFWSGAAFLLYFAYIFASNMYVIFRNQQSADQQSSGQSFWIHIGQKLAALGLLILLCILTALFLMEYWMNLVGVWIYSDFMIENLILALIGLVGLTLNIYLLLASIYFTWIYEREVI